ncbi:MAG: DNA-processing protein DprA [Anaerolineales bacterium]|jgi:DNA processing protein
MQDDLRYWVGFHRIQGIGAVRLRALLERFGNLEQAWHATYADLQSAGLNGELARLVLQARREFDLKAELEKIKASGYRVLCLKDSDYPERLKQIASPPVLLFTWGQIGPEDRICVAIVGTRRPTDYGLAVAQEVAGYLASRGVTVVSGLARGIDHAAHRAALDAGGRTIAVLGSGLDRIYPPEHKRLAAQIAETGCVLSEFPLGTDPEGRNFPIRNRIISGISLAVVVVEAGKRSGALITADFAADQGRDVFAVPGTIHRPMSAGTNRLIQVGAFPLLEPGEILETLNLGLVIEQLSLEEALPQDPEERAVLEQLGPEPLHADEIGKRSGLQAQRVNAVLTMLELKGRVRRTGGMNFVRIAEPGVGYRID